MLLALLVLIGGLPALAEGASVSYTGTTSVKAGQSFEINFSDFIDPLPIDTITLSVAPGNGTLSGYTLSPSVSSVTFTAPLTSDNCAVHYEVTHTDGSASESGDIVITVNPLMPPTVQNKTIDGVRNDAYTFNASDFSYTANDYGSMTAVKITSLPNGLSGTLQFNGGLVVTPHEIPYADIGKLKFHPLTDYYGDVTFNWCALTTSPATYETATATITLKIPASPPPIPKSFEKKGAYQKNLTFAVADFQSGNNTPISKIKITSLPTPDKGILKYSSGLLETTQEITLNTTEIAKITFVPTATWNGSTSVKWKACDAAGNWSATEGTLTLTIDPLATVKAANFTVVTATNVDHTFNRDADFMKAFNTANPTLTGKLSHIKITTIPTPSQGVLYKDSGNTAASQVAVGEVITLTNIDKLRFVPAVNSTATATFTWQASIDGTSFSTTAATVTVNVLTVKAGNFTVTTSANSSYTFKRTADFMTAYNSANSALSGRLTHIKITSIPSSSYGVLYKGITNTTANKVLVNDIIAEASIGSLRFVPADDYTGSTFFSWQASIGGSTFSTNATVTVTVGGSQPVLDTATVSANGKTITIGFDRTIVSNVTTSSLKSYVQLSRNSTSSYATLSSSDSVAISSGKLVITLATAISGTNNRVRILSGALKDNSGIVLNSDVTATIAMGPTADDFSVRTLKNTSYTFKLSDFQTNYSDSGNKSMAGIKIFALPTSTKGSLYLNNTKITSSNYAVSASNIPHLRFEPYSNYTGSATFTWLAYNGTTYTSDANCGTVTINISASDSQPELQTATASANGKSITLSFDRTISSNVTSSSLKSYVQLSRSGTSSYSALGSSDTVSISGSTMVIALNTALTGTNNRIKILSNAIKDSSGNVLFSDLAATVQWSDMGNITVDSANNVNATFAIASTDSQGRATVSVTEDDVSSLLSRSSSASGSGRTIRLNTAYSSSQTAVTFEVPRKLITSASSNKAAKIEFTTGLANITFKPEAFSGLPSGDFSITIAKTSASQYSSLASSLLGNIPVYNFTLKIGSTTMNSFGGTGNVRISLPSTVGYDDNVVIAYVPYNNAPTPVPSSYVGSSSGKLEAKIWRPGAYAAYSNKQSFKDTSSNWALSHINAVSARGVINGLTNGNFAPNSNIKRSEFIKMIVLAFDLADSTSSSVPSDVKTTYWYYTYVAAACKAGIISSNSAFNGEEFITRQDMALYAYRGAQAAGVVFDTTYSSKTFTDQSSISSTYTTAVDALVRAGILSGNPNGSFNPTGKSRRSEGAKIFDLILKQAAK